MFQFVSVADSFKYDTLIRKALACALCKCVYILGNVTQRGQMDFFIHDIIEQMTKRDNDDLWVFSTTVYSQVLIYTAE